MSSCSDLTVSLNPNCDALTKSGGLDKRVWIGLLKDIDSITFTADVNQVTALTFEATKGFVTAIGKRYKNNSAMALEVGENKNVRNQSINLVLYYNTPAELGAIETLLDVEGICVFVETNNGEIEAWGVNKGDNYDNFGLKASALEGGSGTALLDPNQFILTLSGAHENLQMYFNDTAADPQGLAADIAYLDELTV